MLERRSQPGAEARHATQLPKNGIEPAPKKRLGIKVIPYDGIAGVLEFQRLNRAVESAKLKIPIAEAFPLAAAATAHQRLESGPVPGKTC
jgi:NADPH:quinone reductase